MRKVICALLALVCLTSYALADWKSESAGTIANSSIYTGKGWWVADATNAVVAVQFTTASASTGNVVVYVDASLDRGETWTNYTSVNIAVTTAQSYLTAKPMVAAGIPGTATIACVPAPYMRVRVFNGITGGVALTATTLGIIYN